MIDWTKIYLEMVSPVINRATSMPPTAILAIIAIALLGGIALLVWAPRKGKAIGFILVFFVLFIAYMIVSSYFDAKYGVVHFEKGSITNKSSEEFSNKNSQGYSYTDTAYYIEMNVSQAYVLSKDGQGDLLPEKSGSFKYLVDKSLYNQLKEYDDINAVFMSNVDEAIHFVVLPDGSVLK
ncbi:MAG: hypothetical protein KAI79_15570 [Bacteroidales bacterium]|nr:hypothetical protein [Bacteroidales bacterium]